MIWTVFTVHLRRLLHSRTELMLTFVVPVAFFSIFAVIFGGVGSSARSKIRVVIVDQVDSPHSQAVVDTLCDHPGLRCRIDPASESDGVDQARQLVRRGVVSLAIVLTAEDSPLSAELLTDASDQVASQVASAIVHRALTMTALQRSLDRSGQLATSGELDVLPPSDIIDRFAAKPEVANRDRQSSQPPAVANSPSVQVTDVLGDRKSNPVVSMYAAGIAVMFLLFSSAGGGGVLLEERENQTLDRLLSTQLTMDDLLLGKWFYMTTIGTLQVSVMFLWGQIVFGVDLFGHWDGFLFMTVVTASAASAFGLFLATISRSRGQLNGLSVVVILSMSALGGSMIPRYVMSEQLQSYGLLTFNAWALDGYDKVFWRELPAASLSPQLMVLLACMLAFLLSARVLAIRWETD